MRTSHNLLHFFLLLAVCSLFAEDVGAAAKCGQQEKSALLAFRKTLVDYRSPSDSGCDLITWDENVDCCSWDGITCDKPTGSVVAIRLGHMCSRGSSFSFSSNSPLFQLSSLQSLDLSSFNLWQATIPNAIAKLSQLRELNLGRSNLTGTIPDAVGNLTQLRDLTLDMNDLSGSIPLAVVLKLKHLETLQMMNCKLTGSLPSALFHHPHIQYIYLKDNQLTGALPATVPRQSSLVYLDLSGNNLEGTIPSWLFAIPTLRNLILGRNSFGPLETFRKPEMTSLQYVDLSFSTINGPLPSSLLELASMSYLSLRATQLSGVVEWNSFKNMVNLTSLDLSENRGLTLKNSDGTPAILAIFQNLQIASCGVTEFPSFLSGFTDLTTLDVSDNKIGGAAFKESGWEKLIIFNGSHNLITAFEFPNTSWLDTFDLSYNQLKGRLPKPPPELRKVYLSNNQLSGGIPTEFCKRMDELDLSYNTLDGVLPYCFNYQFLSFLHLHNNRLHGVIPSTMGNGTSLESLDLSKNQLRGNIPPSLMNLKDLEYLNLSYNNLEGPIPPGKFPIASYIGNPGLCGPPLSKSC